MSPRVANSATLKHKTYMQHRKQRDLALASMARDDPPTSSMAAASSTAAVMRGKVGSEFET